MSTNEGPAIDRSLAATAACRALAQPPRPRWPAHSVALRGTSGNPPSGSFGSGAAIVGFDHAAQTLCVQATFAGLGGDATAAHIHRCVNPPGHVGVATQTPPSAALRPAAATASTTRAST